LDLTHLAVAEHHFLLGGGEFVGAIDTSKWRTAIGWLSKPYGLKSLLAASHRNDKIVK
jgi:hypothetical protein